MIEDLWLQLDVSMWTSMRSVKRMVHQLKNCDLTKEEKKRLRSLEILIFKTDQRYLRWAKVVRSLPTYSLSRNIIQGAHKIHFNVRQCIKSLDFFELDKRKEIRVI